jgi:phospholipid/cholesterol/gamma-HCH transport system substrate-binding protein
VEAGDEKAADPEGSMKAGRIAGLVALAAAFVLVVVVLLGGGGGSGYRVVLESGGQLVPGNQVLVGGQPIGKVNTLDLTDDGLAEIEITVDEPLHDGTTAVVRSTSLSGIANRYLSIQPGPNNAPELPEDAVLAGEETTAPVDLDQLFATLDEETRASLQDVIQGSATIYAGNTEEARETYKYFAPALQSTERLLAELNRDQRTLSQFLVSGAGVLGAVAERRNDLSALTSNANQALGAISAENEALDRSLAALPPAMRQANTTFVNLRAALDDLDSLVATAKPATKDLAPFLRDLRPVAERAVPVVADLRQAVGTPGPDNDLTDVLRLAPRVQNLAATASDTGIDAINDSTDNVELFRSYSPDLLAAISKLGQVTAYYVGNGHYARVLPAALGAFQYNAGTEELVPSYANPSAQLGFYSTPGTANPAGFERCPGAGSQVAEDGSTPFLQDVAGQCDPADMVFPGASP